MNHTRPQRLSVENAVFAADADISADDLTLASDAPARTLAVPRIRVTVELICYVVLGILAALTRFWDLSSRALHHDESLHAYFSWLYAVGNGYIHDPLMHGPTLFHADALAFLLFGDNDYVSRIWPAALGVALVLMPALLRDSKFLGRWGALTCSTFLLFSPTILYYTRYIRHDPFVLVATLAIVIACLRYLERPEPRWVYLVGIMTGLLFATMEVSFIIAFIMVTFILAVVTWQVSRLAFGVVVATGFGLGAVWLLLPKLGAPALPSIPWEDPSTDNVRSFAIDLVVHPIFLAGLGVVILGIVGVLSTLGKARDPEAESWLSGVLGTQPNDSTAAAVLNVLTDRRTLWISVALGLTIFTALYTSMFMNMGGLASGTAGALGYWLGQHDVQRADQPWFYYLLLLAQYEFIGVLLFPVGVVLTARRLIPAILKRQTVDPPTWLRGFAIYWIVMNLAIYSWAGEKMPWLSVHTALPLAILAASVVGSAIEAIERAVRAGRLRSQAIWVPAVGVPVLTAAWFALWAWGSAGPWVQIQDGPLIRHMRPAVADNPWILYLPLAGLAVVVLWSAFRLGPRMATGVLGVTAVAVILVGQMHVTFRMAFQQGDVPVDMLIYVQSSPDVPQAMTDIGILSRELTGGLDMPIAYDSGTSWPFQWYLRNYENRRFFGSTIAQPPDAPIVIIANENLSGEEGRANAAMLEGYTYFEYSMRWWFPEDETYRKFAIAPELNKENRQNYQNDKEPPYSALDVAESVWHSIWGMHEPAQQTKMFRLVAFRELWAPLGSFNFRVYVRNDLLTTWNQIRY